MAVVLTPSRNKMSSVAQGWEQVLIQVLTPEAAIAALDKTASRIGATGATGALEMETLALDLHERLVNVPEPAVLPRVLDWALADLRQEQGSTRVPPSPDPHMDGVEPPLLERSSSLGGEARWSRAWPRGGKIGWALS